MMAHRSWLLKSRGCRREGGSAASAVTQAPGGHRVLCRCTLSSNEVVDASGCPAGFMAPAADRPHSRPSHLPLAAVPLPISCIWHKMIARRHCNEWRGGPVSCYDMPAAALTGMASAVRSTVLHVLPLPLKSRLWHRQCCQVTHMRYLESKNAKSMKCIRGW